MRVWRNGCLVDSTIRAKLGTGVSPGGAGGMLALRYPAPASRQPPNGKTRTAHAPIRGSHPPGRPATAAELEQMDTAPLTP